MCRICDAAETVAAAAAVRGLREAAEAVSGHRASLDLASRPEVTAESARAVAKYLVACEPSLVLGLLTVVEALAAEAAADRGVH